MIHSTTMVQTSGFLQHIWLAFTLVIGGLQIITAVLYFRDRHVSSWLALIGSLMGAPINFISLMVGLLPRSNHSESLEWDSVMHNLSYFSSLGTLMFAFGMLWIALRRRALSARIAELEQILASQNSRLQ